MKCLYADRAPSTIDDMAYATLRDFLGFLDESGELHRVKAQVSPALEIAEIADRVVKTPAPHGNN